MFLVENLKFNLLSISQLCEKGYKVNFEAHACYIINSNTNQIIYIENRHNNEYVIYIDKIMINNVLCLIVNDVNDSWLCHKRLGHASMRTLSKLVKNDYLWAS